MLFVQRSLPGHVLVFGLLYAMGVGIEYAQEYSNSYTGQKIHGRYDPEDIAANLKGLIYFSVVWGCYVVVWYATRSMRPDATKTKKQPLQGSVVDPVVAGSVHQQPLAAQHYLDKQDKEKVRQAIGLLTEVMNHHHGHPLSADLQDIINQLKNKLPVS
ncbi:MAG: hypothetical protein EOO05_18115 [Chitinophagaceae bacterium]|nr:MAG: hypothetical protein EOO05_18115 [Chitinophagaceae bacterium]